MFFQKASRKATVFLKRKVVALAVSAIFAVSLIFASSANAAGAYDPIIISSGNNVYEFQLVSVTYDPSTTLQYWTYSIHCISGKAISHIVLEFNEEYCNPPMSAIATAGFDNEGPGDDWELLPYTNPDPTTGATGIKYEFGDSIEKGETRQVWFALNGYWPVGTMDAAIKAANVVTSGVLEGPDCIELAVPETPGPFVALGVTMAVLGIFVNARKRNHRT